MCTWRCRVAGRVERVLSCGGASVFVGGWPCVAARKSVGDLILLVSSGCHAGPSTPCLCTNSGVRRTCTRGCGNPSTHAPFTYVYTHNHMRTDRAHLPIHAPAKLQLPTPRFSCARQALRFHTLLVSLGLLLTLPHELALAGLLLFALFHGVFLVGTGCGAWQGL